MRSRFGHRTYRDIAAEYGVTMCSDAKSCELGYSYTAHRRGTADAAHRVIHDVRADNEARREGLAGLLANVGHIRLHSPIDQRPLWRRIYEANIWAYRAARRDWHTTIYVRDTARARRRVLALTRFANVPLRFRHPAVYAWATASLEVTKPNGSKEARPGGMDPSAPQDLRGDGRSADGDQPGGTG